ncbi:hypothetical protein TIFTF001_016615 [Ficus carica]|uniref:Uncharacterized protein n=1 Tax=Ficus carica TaxID=3494 RepID=A0AA88DIV8_FICCA|nr:hypothetical protein TIFTF001_016615 [Ficus carica]
MRCVRVLFACLICLGKSPEPPLADPWTPGPRGESFYCSVKAYIRAVLVGAQLVVDLVDLSLGVGFMLCHERGARLTQCLLITDGGSSMPTLWRIHGGDYVSLRCCFSGSLCSRICTNNLTTLLGLCILG